jgi:hypothetical protein
MHGSRNGGQEVRDLDAEVEQQAGALRFLTKGPVLRRNLTIAVVVGSILSTVNQFEFVVGGDLTPRVLLKIVFNYLVPFTVASVSSCLNRSER